MAGRSPLQTVMQLVDAFNRGDIEAAMALYEPGGVLVARSGSLARGRAALRKALADFFALRPALTSDSDAAIEADGVALYCGRWRLSGTDPDGNEVRLSGRSSDVLRRQPDGRWLVAVDNPWGQELLG